MNTKACSKCGRIFPATLEYFYSDKECRYGVSSICKECRGHKFGIFEKNKPVDGYKICSRCGRNFPYTTEYFYSNGKDLTSSCKECQSKTRKELYYKNHPRVLEYHRNWYTVNIKDDPEYKETAKDKTKKWRIKNQHTESYKETQRIKRQRRTAIKRKLPATYTKNDWHECKNNFDSCCAYCGTKSKKLTQDHFIAVRNGGEYTANNIVPSCQKCNSSKSAHDFFEWYPRQPFYSPEREQKILDYLGYKDGVQQLSIL
jgi:hypothetical protein